MDEKSLIDNHQYLTFSLGSEGFALNIATVREVLELTAITKVPRVPPFMRGVINLRGHAVPVVDMRKKFGLRAAEDTVNTCIIIVEVDFESGKQVLGALVDAVREVLELRGEDIEPAPRMGAAIKTDYIMGMGKHGDDFIIILNNNSIFTEDELAAMSQGADQAGPDAAAA
ncbi:MAG: chemotaxis protein CheW [Desulfovibrionaceae bacterium]|nr:chemotaxis protein CheW [Desulfovibrionaceae bacterium]MBF0514520.1 chemotaxis protein CheW [Desulfovibrionaceae bacterium]